jgi:hypothetical protein
MELKLNEVLSIFVHRASVRHRRLPKLRGNFEECGSVLHCIKHDPSYSAEKHSETVSATEDNVETDCVDDCIMNTTETENDLQANVC